MAVRADTKATIVDFSDKTEEMEDTTIVYFASSDNFCGVMSRLKMLISVLSIIKC
ncbi:MAG: hypothetical protein ACLRQF_17375 [Thomasclavelia ramosa]